MQVCTCFTNHVVLSNIMRWLQRLTGGDRNQLFFHTSPSNASTTGKSSQTNFTVRMAAESTRKVMSPSPRNYRSMECVLYSFRIRKLER